MDITGFTQKVISLEAELQDISSQESKDEASLAKVKKQLRDLEAKVKDQEEELDEQAGTIQMLEQVLEGLATGGTTVPIANLGHEPEEGKISNSVNCLFICSLIHKMLSEHLISASHSVKTIKLPWCFPQEQTLTELQW